jgi:hypothetical protein
MSKNKVIIAALFVCGVAHAQRGPNQTTYKAPAPKTKAQDAKPTYVATWTSDVASDIAALAADQDAKPEPKLIAPTDAARAAYWRAVSMRQAAESATKDANTAFERAVAALCHATHQPISGQDGEPTCQLKPKPEATK